jgi:hypothetical protein
MMSKEMILYKQRSVMKYGRLAKMRSAAGLR